MNSSKKLFTYGLTRGWIWSMFGQILAIGCLVGTVCFSDQVFAQDTPEQFLADYVLADHSVSDFVLAEASILKKEFTQKILEFKSKSLKQRLERSRNLIDQWSNRAKNEEQKALELQKMAEFIGVEILNKGRALNTEASPVTSSQSINDQLLAAALLAYQKISWDVAAEQALIKSKLDSVKPNAALVEGESHIAQLEVQRLTKVRDNAEIKSQISSELYSKGSAGRLEVQTDKNDLERANIELEIAQAKLKLIPIRQAAMETKVVADASEQLVQLQARKKKMEELIQLLQDVSSSCLEREERLQEAKSHLRHSEECMERAESEATRQSEIEYLIQVIETRESK